MKRKKRKIQLKSSLLSKHKPPIPKPTPKTKPSQTEDSIINPPLTTPATAATTNRFPKPPHNLNPLNPQRKIPLPPTPAQASLPLTTQFSSNGPISIAKQTSEADLSDPFSVGVTQKYLEAQYHIAKQANANNGYIDVVMDVKDKVRGYCNALEHGSSTQERDHEFIEQTTIHL